MLIESFNAPLKMLSKTFVNSLPLMACAIHGVAAISKGHDLSSAGYMETEQGATWLSESGSTSTIEDILGAGGMDSVRLRYVLLNIQS